MTLPLPFSLTRRCRAIVLPAPGRFWTSTLRASLASSITLAAVRAVWSNPPPGAVPTRMFSPVICRLPPPPPPTPSSDSPQAVATRPTAMATSNPLIHARLRMVAVLSCRWAPLADSRNSLPHRPAFEREGGLRPLGRLLRLGGGRVQLGHDGLPDRGPGRRAR